MPSLPIFLLWHCILLSLCIPDQEPHFWGDLVHDVDDNLLEGLAEHEAVSAPVRGPANSAMQPCSKRSKARGVYACEGRA